MQADRLKLGWVADRDATGRRAAPISPETDLLLAGDIGHTKIYLALCERTEGGWRTLRSDIFSSVETTGLDPVIHHFLTGQTASIRAACFGLAGPVVEGRCRPTDLSWEVSAEALRELLHTADVDIINDMAALAYSLPWLAPEQLFSLQAGRERPGNRALIAAGTGLGECTLFWDGTSYHPSACEGGHVDFAARNEWEVGLWRFMDQRYEGHVSYSRIVSGRGLQDLFDYVVATGVHPDPKVDRARHHESDPTPAIVAAGLSGTCPACVEALDHFLDIYGAEAGNLALKSLAVGGLYVGGGIAPRMLDRMGNGRFMRGFRIKGRFSRLVSDIPVRVILEPKAALLGALRRAAHRSGA